MALFTNDILLDSIGICISLLAIFFVYVKISFQYWEKRNVPYLPPTIPWGNLRPPFRREIPVAFELTSIHNQAKAKGWKYVGYYSMTEPIFMPLQLDLVKCVMTKDFPHFVDRGSYTNEKVEPISAHLFAIGGKKWRDLRTKLTPTFTSGKMRSMFQTIADSGTILENYVRHELDAREPVDIKDVLGCYSTDIIGSCAFGLDCNSFKEPDTPFRRFGKKAFEADRLRSLSITFSDSFPTISRFLGLRAVDKGVDEFFTNIVHDTVDYREKKNVKRPDFLQMLIELKNYKKMMTGDKPFITMNEIVAQSFVFFVAGFETSATTMTFALYVLATHPEIQEKVRDEIEAVMKKHDDQITFDSLKELKYMDQVIDETLRLYPPVPFLTRRCVQDYKVPDSDVIIEKGTTVMIPVRAIHYDPEYYENPEVFDPERFNEENKKSRHPYAHLPFGEGPRICIGMRFGLTQTKVGLLCIVRNFRVKVNSRTKQPLEIALDSTVTSTKGGMWLDLERITR